MWRKLQSLFGLWKWTGYEKRRKKEALETAMDHIHRFLRETKATGLPAPELHEFRKDLLRKEAGKKLKRMAQQSIKEQEEILRCGHRNLHSHEIQLSKKMEVIFWVLIDRCATSPYETGDHEYLSFFKEVICGKIFGDMFHELLGVLSKATEQAPIKAKQSKQLT